MRIYCVGGQVSENLIRKKVALLSTMTSRFCPKSFAKIQSKDSTEYLTVVYIYSVDLSVDKIGPSSAKKGKKRPKKGKKRPMPQSLAITQSAKKEKHFWRRKISNFLFPKKIFQCLFMRVAYLQKITKKTKKGGKRSILLF